MAEKKQSYADIRKAFETGIKRMNHPGFVRGMTTTAKGCPLVEFSKANPNEINVLKRAFGSQFEQYKTNNLGSISVIFNSERDERFMSKIKRGSKEVNKAPERWKASK